jgi:small subunit ribosomal protein S20
MPITKSAIKQMKQAETRRKHNREVKADFRNKIKAVQKDLDSGGKNVASLASETFSALDKAAKRNIIHKRTAARRKSRLMSLLNKTMQKPLELKSSKDKSVKMTTPAKAKKAKVKTVKKTTKKSVKPIKKKKAS